MKKFYAYQEGVTRLQVYDQLERSHLYDGVSFSDDALTDQDIQWWVDKDFDLRDEFPNEEEYNHEIKHLNDRLIERVMSRG